MSGSEPFSRALHWSEVPRLYSGRLARRFGQVLRILGDAESGGADARRFSSRPAGWQNVSAQECATLSPPASRKLSGVDDEAIASAENLILTFKNVRNVAGEGNQIFDRAALAALDLSKAAGGAFGDLPTTAKQLAKALNDPVRGMTALGRAGVTFSNPSARRSRRWSRPGDARSPEADPARGRVPDRRLGEGVRGDAPRSVGEGQRVIPQHLRQPRSGCGRTPGAGAGGVLMVHPQDRGGHRTACGCRWAELGEAFDVVLPMIQNLVRTIQQSLPNIQRIIGAIVDPIRTNVLPIVRDLQSVFQTAFQNITDALSDNAGSLRTISRT